MRTAVQSISERKPARRSMQGTILVVDDEPALRAFVTYVLAQEGYSVLSASNAEEALVLAANRGASIQVLLTDVEMPGIGGLALVGKLSRMLPQVRPIFMSGSLSVEPEVDTPFLHKPFQVRDLLQTVQSRIAGC